ncbi:hypothetical protein NC651_039746 [Populus alba x Populus x berolinensis]|nr:hypothetical protein NC651_039746 [Populus alba x Populus x berolinensis]
MPTHHVAEYCLTRGKCIPLLFIKQRHNDRLHFTATAQ